MSGAELRPGSGGGSGVLHIHMVLQEFCHAEPPELLCGNNLGELVVALDHLLVLAATCPLVTCPPVTCPPVTCPPVTCPPITFLLLHVCTNERKSICSLNN